MIQLIENKAMILNPNNIGAVVENPEAYRGYTFVISGESIRKRRGYTKFYYFVGELLKVWRHLDWEFRIVAPRGISSIDKNVAVYVNEVV